MPRTSCVSFQRAKRCLTGGNAVDATHCPTASRAGRAAGHRSSSSAGTALQPSIQSGDDPRGAGADELSESLLLSDREPQVFRETRQGQGPRTVKITDSTAGATIYYTTDGWTPTVESQRYTGPTKISTTTTLRAIAISPRTGRSFVTAAKYTIDPPGSSSEFSRWGCRSIRRGTRDDSRKNRPPARHQGASRVCFSAGVEDRRSERQNRVDARPGRRSRRRRRRAQGLARHRTHRASGSARIWGMPGQVNFHVDALSVHGTVIELRCTAAFEGQAKPPRARVLIPVVGTLALF